MCLSVYGQLFQDWGTLIVGVTNKYAKIEQPNALQGRRISASHKAAIPTECDIGVFCSSASLRREQSALWPPLCLTSALVYHLVLSDGLRSHSFGTND